ncbi:Endoplasmin-like protein [Diplonema papillatum]|nr:Endoplasmin-like protein [Diplonema papillatum]
MRVSTKAVFGLLLFSVVVALCNGEEAAAADEKPQGEKHGFQAEVSKMLDIIINSLYTNRNVFLREVISNASDALDKIRFLYLTNPKTPVSKDGTAPTMDVRIKVDKEARTLTITDGGIGMSKEDMIKHLGSLGSSDTKAFAEKLKGASEESLIGQFGVGFYSVFLVADEVKVSSKNDESETQWVWKSKADGEFFVYEDPRGNSLGRGTEIELTLKKDAEEYLETEQLITIATKYSEFIQFPIYIQIEKTEKVPKEKEESETETEKDEDAEVEDAEKEEEKEEFEEVTTLEWKHVNENKPIWQRKADEISDEEYASFYKAITKDYSDPLAKVHFSAEGEVEFRSILYIPKHMTNQPQGPAQETPKNIRLYVRRVFITDEFNDLLPRYLSFLQGVVDSDDLPLNVSRELLQESRILKIIKKKLIRKALSMMKDLADADEPAAKEDGEKEEADAEKEEEPKEKLYPTFWKEFGRNIRLGVIEDGTNRSRLTKLLRYQTSKSGEDIKSLDKYVQGMLEGQKEIYFIVGESLDKLKAMPAVEDATKRGIEVIYMLDAIDEYVVGHMTDYDGHKLVNIATEAPKIGDDDARAKKVEKARKARYQPLVDWCKDLFGDRVQKVVITKRQTDAPMVVSSPQHGITANMARIMKGQALGEKNGMYNNVKRVLELNIRNPVIDEINKRIQADAEDQQAKDTASILFDIYSLQGGFDLDQPKSLSTHLERMLKSGLDIDPSAGLVDEEEYDIEEEEEEEEAAAEEEEVVGEEAGAGEEL